MKKKPTPGDVRRQREAAAARARAAGASLDPEPTPELENELLKRHLRSTDVREDMQRAASVAIEKLGAFLGLMLGSRTGAEALSAALAQMDQLSFEQRHELERLADAVPAAVRECFRITLPKR